MSTPAEVECAVCDKKTSQRCSGCSNVAFCSREHQQLLWKSHKWFCRKPAPTSFSLPPLSAEDAAPFLKPVSPVDGPFLLNFPKKTRAYWDEYCAMREWYPASDMTGEELIRELRKKEGCAIAEPNRSFIIAALGQYLYLRSTMPDRIALPPPSNGAWHMTGHDLTMFMDECRECKISLPHNVLEILDPMMQTILIYHTVSLDPKAFVDGQQGIVYRMSITGKLLPLLKDLEDKLGDPAMQAMWQVVRNCCKGATTTPMLALMEKLFGKDVAKSMLSGLTGGLSDYM
ncbi:hypothetical protein JCM8097_009055 [Rhodosporidiobolus ruineniae]